MAKKTEQRQTYHLAVSCSPEEMEEFVGIKEAHTARVYICPKALQADSRLAAEKLVLDKKPAELLKMIGILDPGSLDVSHYFFVLTLPARKIQCTILKPVEKIVRFVEAEQIEANLGVGFAETSDKQDKNASEERSTTESSQTTPAGALPNAPQDASSPSGSHATLVVPPSEAAIRAEQADQVTEKSPSTPEEKPSEEQKREPVPDISGL